MIPVVCDAVWQAVYDATTGADDYRVHMANSVWRLKKRIEMDLNAKTKKSIVVLSNPPLKVEAPPVQPTSTCQAVNLNNKRCQFKATCGKFCRKHQVTVSCSLVKPEILVV